MMLKTAFSKSIGRPGAPLHFAAHSHHPWLDVTLAAQTECWNDAAALLDRKWEKIFGQIVPEAKTHVARVLNLPGPETLVFGENTHEFLLRILSCLPQGRAFRILTTDGEFHSFTRQIARLEEAGCASVTRIETEPLATFAGRFAAAARNGVHEFIYFSQVFFNSGFWIEDLNAIVRAVPSPETLVAIDGYHGFMAVPTDLSAIADRAFYLAGGYKYAMAGEGAVFMHCPPGAAPRPVNTGWYAEFAHLADRKPGTIGYACNAERFAGATFDPVGIYRLNAVMRWITLEGLSVGKMLGHAHKLQDRLVSALKAGTHCVTGPNLVVPLSERRGRFLTFRTDRANTIQQNLEAKDILTDARGDRLRIGFGVYHDEGDVDRLAHALDSRGL
jgi:selenocysteine lyase/cysteine desulfurase